MPPLNRWWKGTLIALLALEALVIALGSPPWIWLMVGGGVLLIGAIVPPWLDQLKVVFSRNATLTQRLWAWFCPWGVSTGSGVLLLAGLMVLGGVAIALSRAAALLR